MTSDKPSPTNKTYLICIDSPQGVTQTVVKIKEQLKHRGLQNSPLPPGIPISVTSRMPKPPVPGLLPVCDKPLLPEKSLAIISDSSSNKWIIWPVETSGWLKALYKAILKECGISDQENNKLLNPLFPTLKGIPLARPEEKGSESILLSPEVNSILKKTPGWRAIILSCWEIEYLTDRYWHKAAAWRPLWHRRLKRAPTKD